MNSELGKQLVKSATAILCSVSVCITASSSVGKVADAIKESAKYSSSDSSAQQFENESGDEAAFGESNDNAGEENSDAEAAEENAASDDESAEKADSENANQGDSNNSSDSKKTQASGNKASKPASNVPSTKAEIINYCNTALNKVKSSKPGYNKKYVMNVQGKATGAIDKLKGLVTKDETSTIKKGDDSTDTFPAAGYSWSSKLRESDVASAQLKTNGQYYDITLKLGNETNPAKGEASKYGRVMSVIDANDAKDMLPGIKSITMNYHNGYVFARIDSKTGRVVKAEFSASADIKASIAIFGDIEVNDIVSTETFTDFKW